MVFNRQIVNRQTVNNNMIEIIPAIDYYRGKCVRLSGAFATVKGV